MKSIVSYEERGTGGNNRYRGNCSPRLIEDLIQQFHVSEISDYMAGSFTTADAAKRMGIQSHCYDLNSGFDLLQMEIPERSEFTFWHPPYWNLIQYADGQYSADEVIRKYGIDPRKSDLSRAETWEKFVELQNFCMMKLYAALDKGGRLAVLMGDIKKKGRLYSQLLDIVKPGTIENIVIKAQYNYTSERTKYNGDFIPIVHEYLLIVRKDFPLMIEYSISETGKTDIRDIAASSWKDVVYGVMKELNREARLPEIYEMIEGHKKTEKNPNWKAKIRQTLQNNKEFTSKHYGRWQLA